MTSNRTPQAIEGAVAEVAASHPDVAAAAIFGSHARGTARATSDLDVAILLREGAEVDRWRLQSRLAADLAHHAAGGRVDVIFLDEVGPLLRQRVLQQGRRVLCRDEAAWKRLRVTTLREYDDTEWMRRLHREARRRRLLEGQGDGRSGRTLESLERVGGLPRRAAAVSDPEP
jgi:predicted nucleotidyltransferase